jgi:hypothetical protein
MAKVRYIATIEFSSRVSSIEGFLAAITSMMQQHASLRLQPITAVEALIQQWRDEAETARKKAVSPPFHGLHRAEESWEQNGIDDTYRRCADDLERALKGD